MAFSFWWCGWTGRWGLNRGRATRHTLSPPPVHGTAFTAPEGGAAYGGYNRNLPRGGPGRSVDGVDNRTAIREFLATRRARLTPEQVGLPAGGGRRRVQGLR